MKGKAVSKCNPKQKEQTLKKWKENDWVVSLKPTGVQSALCKVKARLAEEVAMEREVQGLKSELAGQQHRVRDLESQVLAEREMNTPPTMEEKEVG